MPIAAEFASGSINIDDARNVRVGDVLEMETSTKEPTVICVGGEPKFRGIPFAPKDGNMTVKVSEVLTPEAAETLKNRSRRVRHLST
jgi:flagellar motor switch protein FliM